MSEYKTKDRKKPKTAIWCARSYMSIFGGQRVEGSEMSPQIRDKRRFTPNGSTDGPLFFFRQCLCARVCVCCLPDERRSSGPGKSSVGGGEGGQHDAPRKRRDCRVGVTIRISLTAGQSFFFKADWLCPCNLKVDDPP